jgi:hypothetical protein
MDLRIDDAFIGKWAPRFVVPGMDEYLSRMHRRLEALCGNRLQGHRPRPCEL